MCATGAVARPKQLSFEMSAPKGDGGSSGPGPRLHGAVLECPVCSEEFNPTNEDRKPLSLHCAHSVCASCVNKLPKKADLFHCPVCRLTTPWTGNVKDVKPNYALIEMMERVAAELTTANSTPSPSPSGPPAGPSCSFCGEKPATMHCDNCSEDFQQLCEPCCNQVHSHKARESHKRAPIHKRPPSAAKLREKNCSVHNLPARLYCKPCKAVICGECGVLTHKGHDIVQVAEIEAEIRARLTADVEKASKVSAKVALLIENDAKLADEVTAETEVACKRVEAEFKVIEDALQQRKQQVLLAVAQDGGSMVRGLNARRKNMAVSLSVCDAAAEECRRYLGVGMGSGGSSGVDGASLVAAEGRLRAQLSAGVAQCAEWEGIEAEVKSMVVGCRVDFDSVGLLDRIRSFGVVVGRLAPSATPPPKGPPPAPQTFEYSGAIVEHKLPSAGTVRITARGAKAANGISKKGGSGAIISGEFKVQGGEVLHILCGGMSKKRDPDSGGGGGTFVAIGERKDPVVVAGGGGGTCGSDFDGSDASLEEAGGDGRGSSSDQFSKGGRDGMGALVPPLGHRGGGGAGYRGDGTHGAKSFLNGGAAGTSYVSTDGGPFGGFGGGGATGYYGGGGGGGYSGGGAGQGGGGGGSFVSSVAKNVTKEVGNTGAGQVIIEYLSTTRSLDRIIE